MSCFILDKYLLTYNEIQYTKVKNNFNQKNKSGEMS